MLVFSSEPFPLYKTNPKSVLNRVHPPNCPVIAVDTDISQFWLLSHPSSIPHRISSCCVLFVVHVRAPSILVKNRQWICTVRLINVPDLNLLHYSWFGQRVITSAAVNFRTCTHSTVQAAETGVARDATDGVACSTQRSVQKFDRKTWGEGAWVGVKMDLKETGREGVYKIHLAEATDQCRDVRTRWGIFVFRELCAALWLAK
jgi:hypothetical protein